MQYELLVMAAAEAELSAAVEWYAQRNLAAALRLETAVKDALRSLREAPLRWAEFMPRTRRIMVVSFPYWLVYRVQGDRVRVVAFMHQRRRPGVWRVRGPCGG